MNPNCKWMWWRRNYTRVDEPLHAWVGAGFWKPFPELAKRKQGGGESPLRIWVEGEESAFRPPGKPKRPKFRARKISPEQAKLQSFLQRLRAAMVRNG